MYNKVVTIINNKEEFKYYYVRSPPAAPSRRGTLLIAYTLARPTLTAHRMCGGRGRPGATLHHRHGLVPPRAHARLRCFHPPRASALPCLAWLCLALLDLPLPSLAFPCLPL
eukprot:3152232-Rhodomonas_salina.1